MKIRQPLTRALIGSAARAQLDDELVAEICAELNIGAVATFDAAGDVVDYSAKANFRALGKRYARQTPAVANAVAAADAARLAAGLPDHGRFTLPVPGIGDVELTCDDICRSLDFYTRFGAAPDSPNSGGDERSNGS